MTWPFTTTKITWALSSMAPQVPGLLRDPLCAHGVLGAPHREVHDNECVIVEQP